MSRHGRQRLWGSPRARAVAPRPTGIFAAHTKESDP
jgi:hypothetical protein